MHVSGHNDGFNDGFGGTNNKGYLQLVTPLSAGSYEDGDILSAVPWRKVRQERAESLCFAKTIIEGNRKVDRLVDGLYPAGDIAEDYLSTTSQFKYERLNATQNRVTRLSDNDEIVFENNVPFVQHDGKTVSMDMDFFLRRRKAVLNSIGGNGRPIFGTNGNEYYFGGNSNASNANLDTVWTAIESKTAFLESVECDKAHFSNYRKRLVISVNDMTDEEASLIVSPKEDIENVTVDSVSPDGNNYTVVLSTTAPALASVNGAVLVDINQNEYAIEQVNGSTLTVFGTESPPTGVSTIKATIAKRSQNVEWRNLQDVVEADVLSPSEEVRIDQIRKYVRETTILNK
jgi:hypothetical protein